jgi:hypothetical protein
MKAKLGFCELLERCAEVIDREAAGLRDAHTLRGRWPKGEDSVRADYTEMRDLAKQLRRSAKYHKPNPLGGPAVIFDACANAIRAGDPINRAMADYGLKFKKGPA